LIIACVMSIKNELHLGQKLLAIHMFIVNAAQFHTVYLIPGKLRKR
jgi:hypothetical protein